MSRLAELTSWHGDWRGLRVVVIGLGKTGFSVADTLAELGAVPLVIAEHADPELVDIVEVLGVELLLGEAAEGVPSRLVAFAPELVITSPGVRPDNELIQWAGKQGLEIWVDIDLAWRLRDKTTKVAEWLVITGTNGKTTTTQLTAEMLNQAGFRTAACGNIGTPILDAIRDPEGFDFLVAELSSFQLHYLGHIEPLASAVLNIADDHLDWHGSFEAYRDTKGKIFQNTRLACVYNLQDATTEHLLEQAEVQEGARAIGFTTGVPPRSAIGFVDDILCDRAFIENRADSALPLADFEDLAEIGVLTPHLMANVAAAAAMARAAGVSDGDIRRAIRAFRLDPHRIELVLDSAGVRYFDDSKATNPHAANASLASFESVVWICGGLLKGVDLSPLIEKYRDKLRAVILIGAERTDLRALFERLAPAVPLHEAAAGRGDGSAAMEQAVALAVAAAEPGDTVLLAPAAASMDQFKDYADRGRLFADAVRRRLSA